MSNEKITGKEFFSEIGREKTADLTKVCEYCGLYLTGGSYIVYMGAYFCDYICFYKEMGEPDDENGTIINIDDST